MKKKRFVGLLSLLAFASVVTSCGTSTPTSGSSSSAPTVSSSSPSGESSTTPAEGTEGDYATPTLNNGFAVATGIPDKKGTITKEKVVAVLAAIEGSVGTNDLSGLADMFLPYLAKAGWTDADADKVLQTVQSEAFQKGLGGLIAFLQQPGDPAGLYTALPSLLDGLRTLLGDLDADKFAAIVVPVGVTLLPGLFLGGVSTEIQPFNIYSMSEVLQAATGDVKTYFEGVQANSRDQAAKLQAYLSSAEFEEAFWLVGRTAHGFLSAILENFTNDEIVEIVKFVMGIVTAPNASEAMPSATEMAKMAKLAGRLLDKCLMDRAALKELILAVGTFSENVSEAMEPQTGYSYSIVASKQRDYVQTMADGSDDIFNAIKYVAVLLENATEENVEDILHLIQTVSQAQQPSQGEQQAPDLVPDIVAMVKLAVENLTRFGSDSEAVLDSLKSVVGIFLEGAFSGESYNSTTTDGRTSLVLVQQGMAVDPLALDALLDKAMAVAALDPDSLTDADRALVNELLAGAQAIVKVDNTRLDIEMDQTMYTVGQEVGSLDVTVTTEYGTEDAKTEERTILASDIENLSTESPRFDIATAEIGDFLFSWNYTVSNYAAQVDLIEVLGSDGKILSAAQKDMELEIDPTQATKIRYVLSGDASYEMGLEDVVNLDLTSPGHKFVFLPLGEGDSKEYLPLDVYVFDF